MNAVVQGLGASIMVSVGERGSHRVRVRVRHERSSAITGGKHFCKQQKNSGVNQKILN